MNNNVERTQKASLQKKNPRIFRFNIMPTINKTILTLILIWLFARVIFPYFIRPTFFSYAGYLPIVQRFYRIFDILFWGTIVLGIISCIHTSSKHICIVNTTMAYMRGFLFLRCTAVNIKHIQAVYLPSSFWNKRADQHTLIIQMKLNDAHTSQKDGESWLIKLQRRLFFKNELVFKNLENANQAFELITQIMLTSTSENT